VPLLIKAMQEQQGTIGDLTAQDTALQAEMRAMRAQLAALHEQVARLLKLAETPPPR